MFLVLALPEMLQANIPCQFNNKHFMKKLNHNTQPLPSSLPQKRLKKKIPTHTHEMTDIGTHRIAPKGT